MTFDTALLFELSAGERALAEQAMTEREARRRETSEALERNLAKAMEGLRRARQKLLRAGGLEELQRGLRAETRRSRESLQPPGGIGADADKENTARKRRGNALLKKLGATPEQMADAGRAAQEQARKLLEATDGKMTEGYHLEANLQKWLDLSPLHETALPWGVVPDTGEPDPYPWTLFRPPFFWFDFHFAPLASAHFAVDREMTLIPGSGLVGHVVTMDCNDADDWDLAQGIADTAIAFVLEPPTDGVIQVLIDAQNIASSHDLRMGNEWGFSNGWGYHHNSLTLNVLHPNVAGPSLAMMSEWGKDFDKDGEGSYHDDDLIFGQHYFAFLESAGSVPAGQSVVVEIGTRSFDIARADDISLHSRSEFLWLINSIEIRTKP
jgi:hypothetical protein